MIGSSNYGWAHTPMERPIKRHLDFLDLLRGWAILLVLVHHSLITAFSLDELPWGPWFRNFTVPRSYLALVPTTFMPGLEIFFVLSGFCIHLSFSRQSEWWILFQKRFFRIYPPYLAALLFFALVYPLTKLHFASWVDVAQVLTHLTLLHNFDQRSFFGINPSFWSIAVQVQLYALYPLLIALTTRFGWRRSLVSIAAIEIILRLTDGVVLTAGGTGLPSWLSGSPLMYWFSWSLGAVVAERYLRGDSLLIPRVALCAVGALAISCTFFKPLSSMKFLFFALVTAGVVAKLLQKADQKISIPDFLHNHLQQIGLWSFSLYLLHQPLLWGVKDAATITFGANIHPFIMFVLCIASWVLIVPIARLYYRLFERPSIALVKFLHPPNAPNQAPQPSPMAQASRSSPVIEH
jgi:peptidoglycan/LPS O-acetylase OafA/YrhL